jgi:hypothetical protein
LIFSFFLGVFFSGTFIICLRVWEFFCALLDTDYPPFSLSSSAISDLTVLLWLLVAPALSCLEMIIPAWLECPLAEVVLFDLTPQLVPLDLPPSRSGVKVLAGDHASWSILSSVLSFLLSWA